jgi:hypothetical protein
MPNVENPLSQGLNFRRGRLRLITTISVTTKLAA